MNIKLKWMFFCLPCAAFIKLAIVSPTLNDVLSLAIISAFLGFSFWKIDDSANRAVESRCEELEGKFAQLEKKLREYDIYIAGLKLNSKVKSEPWGKQG